MDISDLKQAFDDAAAALPETDFAERLKNRFGEPVAQQLLGIFSKMGLPAPEKKTEFFDGIDGPLVFLNRYGVVIRIEENHNSLLLNKDSPQMIQPLAAMKIGTTSFEICPGCMPETQKESSEVLRHYLLLQELNFYDHGVRNIGRLPVYTERFPEGLPVVIDRNVVRHLSEESAPVREALDKLPAIVRETSAAQENLYAPLRRAFAGAWPDAKKMQAFWTLCRNFKAEGKLVAGWNKKELYHLIPNPRKTKEAASTAKSYEARFPAARKIVPDPSSLRRRGE